MKPTRTNINRQKTVKEDGKEKERKEKILYQRLQQKRLSQKPKSDW
jgi:hypothetical protein